MRNKQFVTITERTHPPHLSLYLLRLQGTEIYNFRLIEHVPGEGNLGK